jgi:hypothetical protein
MTLVPAKPNRRSHTGLSGLANLKLRGAKLDMGRRAKFTQSPLRYGTAVRALIAEKA